MAHLGCLLLLICFWCIQYNITQHVGFAQTSAEQREDLSKLSRVLSLHKHVYIYIVKFSLCVWFCGRSVFLIPAAKGYHHFSVLKKENQLNTEQILFFVQHLNSWIQHESNPCLPRGGEGWGIWCSLWKWGKSMPSPLPAFEIGDPFYRLWWRRVGCIPDWTHEWD